MSKSDRRLVTRVVLRNYKSIAACDVSLGQLMFLVGPNGSGKSNFLDALRFVADSLRSTLDHAVRERGGINEVRRRSTGHPNHFGIRLDVKGPDWRGHFAFEVAARKRGAFEVKEEECTVVSSHGDSGHYRVVSGKVLDSTFTPAPPAARDRLYLVTVSGHQAFRATYDSLSEMGFYNLNPDEIRELQSPDPGHLLQRSGRNLASVLAYIESTNSKARDRIVEYLSKVVPGISGADAKTVGPMETIEFRQEVRGASHPWRFLAKSMSDGTLRALGVLVALLQGTTNGRPTHHLVGIEEPELALHPAASDVLLDCLNDAAENSQVLVTSHSPDLLDNQAISDDAILAVVSEHGETHLGPLDETGRDTLRKQLYSAGELLRMDQLSPDPEQSRFDPHQLELFGPER